MKARLLFWALSAVLLLLGWGWANWPQPTGVQAQPTVVQMADAPAPQPSLPEPRFLPELDAFLRQLESQTGSQIGLAAWHLESGNRYFRRENERFAQASVYKLAIATHVLQCVQRGTLSLDSVIPVRISDYCPGSGVLVYSLRYGDTQASVRRLLHLMLAESDNTATDVLLRTCGGAYAVQEAIDSWGIAGLRVDRSVAGMFAGCTARPLPLAHQRSLASMDSRYLYSFTPQEMAAAAQRMRTDSLDSATPASLLSLLHQLHAGKLLSAEMREVLYDALRRCNTGHARIPRAMPQGSVIYHKTGTFFGTCNDAAIVQLPGGRGHLLLVVLTKGPAHSKPQLERTVADAAAALYLHLPLPITGEGFGG